MISHNTFVLHEVSALQITSGFCTFNRGIGENNQDMVKQWAFGDSQKVSQISFDTTRVFDVITIEIQGKYGGNVEWVFYNELYRVRKAPCHIGVMALMLCCVRILFVSKLSI